MSDDDEYEIVEVVISPGGKVEIEVKAVTGKGCMKITEGVEAILGGKVQRDFKPEFYEGGTVDSPDVIKKKNNNTQSTGG